MISALKTTLSTRLDRNQSSTHRQELVCFDCLSQALDYRESVEEQGGQHHSILRLEKHMFGVAPLPLVNVLKGAGFQIMVQ
ncbi:hypothetical protein GCM10027341_12410 [Spirosoma knui]